MTRTQTIATALLAFNGLLVGTFIASAVQKRPVGPWAATQRIECIADKTVRNVHFHTSHLSTSVRYPGFVLQETFISPYKQCGEAQ